MQLKNLAYTPEEMAANSPKVADTPEEYKGPKYPWGLTLYLEDAVLKKLGVDVTKLKVGQEIPIQAIGLVTSLSMNENEQGKTQCVNLVLAEMALEGETSDAERAEKLFGEKK